MEFDYNGFLKAHRKKPIFDAARLPSQLTIGREQIEHIIPHREPLLLIDLLTGINLEKGLIAGTRHVSSSDPVFRPHLGI